MVLTPKLVIGGLALVAVIFGAVEGCDRWNARQREKADRERKVADSTAAVGAARDTLLARALMAIDRSRIEQGLLSNRALNRAERDRGGRDVVYRTVKDTAALRIIRQKDTTIDSLSVALVSEKALHDTTRFVLDIAIVSRDTWRLAYEARTREAESLRKVTPSWWKERIKPRATCGYNATFVRADNSVKHGPGCQVGFQVFP